MRILMVLFFISVFGSCARMPFDKWNKSLAENETKLIQQKKEANQLASPTSALFNGVYNMTQKRDAAPYPVLKKMAESIKSENQILAQKTDSCLRQVARFKAKYRDAPLKNIGPEWSDYTSLLSEINSQASQNDIALTNIRKADHNFDSICQVHKIKSVPLFEYETEIASIITDLEDEFIGLQSTYKSFKTTITQKEDSHASMKAMGQMNQQIRRIENEFNQISNLYSRLNSLRSDAMLFEGPHIKKTLEIQLIEDKTKSIKQFLS